jgi:RNA polymerase sigma factor (sigma-70 family)
MEEAENPTQIRDYHRTPDEKAEIVELKKRICEIMKNLSQREQDLIEAKYFYDKKLKDIAVEFNISQSRISRIIQNVTPLTFTCIFYTYFIHYLCKTFSFFSTFAPNYH